VVKKTNLIMTFGYARGGYLMAKTTPSPDFDDDDDRRHAESALTARRGRMTFNRHMNEPIQEEP
jgi:hypothetical protein